MYLPKIDEGFGGVKWLRAFHGSVTCLVALCLWPDFQHILSSSCRDPLPGTHPGLAHRSGLSLLWYVLHLQLVSSLGSRGAFLLIFHENWLLAIMFWGHTGVLLLFFPSESLGCWMREWGGSEWGRLGRWFGLARAKVVLERPEQLGFRWAASWRMDWGRVGLTTAMCTSHHQRVMAAFWPSRALHSPSPKVSESIALNRCSCHCLSLRLNSGLIRNLGIPFWEIIAF